MGKTSEQTIYQRRYRLKISTQNVPVSLVTKEMHPKTTKKYYHTPTKWWGKKKDTYSLTPRGWASGTPTHLIVGMQNCITALEDRLEVSYKS